MFINTANFTKTSLLFFLSVITGLFSTPVLADNAQKNAQLPVCAYIASYAPGYHWQDRISQTINNTLKDQCQVKSFYMDSKKVNQPAQLKDVGLMAKQFIELIQPDVLLFSDDNAVKYVLQPFFKDANIPAAFCGLNETGKPYGLPYQNATGMIEVAGYFQLIHKLIQLNSYTQKIAYLSGASLSEKKAMSSFRNLAQTLDIETVFYKSRSEKEWRKQFKKLNADPSVDFIVMGGGQTFPEWNHDKNITFVKQETKKITVGLIPSMLPYAVLGTTKSPEEQGRWAALVAIELLKGTPASEIPIIPSHKIQYWYHPTMINLFPKILLPADFMPFIGFETK